MISMQGILDSILNLALASAPWLLLGLLLAGLIKPLFPEALIKRLLGGNGLLAIMRSSVIGIPLPLCSCGAIPTAIALYRAGAGRGPATSFLVSTPGVGVDSLTLTYALLGPFMAIARLLGAIISAIACGLAVAVSGLPKSSTTATSPPSEEHQSPASNCCDDGCHSEPSKPARGLRALGQGIGYALSDLLDDIIIWITIGIIIAGVLTALIPETWIASHGQGLPMMIGLALIGIPLYLCASAATPIAAAMLSVGVSPGATLVFLLAAPITSSATLAVFWRTFGVAATGAYVLVLIITTVLFGLACDALVTWNQWTITPTLGDSEELLPVWIEWAALILLILCAIKPLRRRLGGLVVGHT